MVTCLPGLCCPLTSCPAQLAGAGSGLQGTKVVSPQQLMLAKERMLMCQSAAFQAAFKQLSCSIRLAVKFKIALSQSWRGSARGMKTKVKSDIQRCFSYRLIKAGW